jgi:hypothetical protein
MNRAETEARLRRQKIQLDFERKLKELARERERVAKQKYRLAKQQNK